MPVGAEQPRRSFDGWGYALLAFGMVAVSVALDGLSGMGLGTALVAVLMVFGLASLAAYWMHALRVPEPLFPPALFSVRSLRVGLLGNLFARFGSGAAPFLIPLLLQVGLGMSPFHAGLMMLATVVGSMLVKRIAVRTVQRLATAACCRSIRCCWAWCWPASAWCRRSSRWACCWPSCLCLAASTRCSSRP
jgi:hypothetical protein